MIDMKLLGRRLHLSRLDLSLQQKELAVIAGISSSYLSELEKGRAKNVTMKRLSPLAKALNVSVAYLLGETPDPLLGQHDDPADDASLLREESAPYTVRRASAEERIIWVLHMLEPVLSPRLTGKKKPSYTCAMASLFLYAKPSPNWRLLRL